MTVLGSQGLAIHFRHTHSGIAFRLTIPGQNGGLLEFLILYFVSKQNTHLHDANNKTFDFQVELFILQGFTYPIVKIHL